MLLSYNTISKSFSRTRPEPNLLCKALLFTMLLLCGQALSATPRDDANYIALRNFNNAEQVELYRSLKKAFVPVYFRPLSGLGIQLLDEERFIDLIPDEDVVPFIDSITAEIVEFYLTNYSPEQLAVIAAALRADDNATIQDILSADYQHRYAEALLDEIRRHGQPSGSDDPQVVALEELTLQLNVIAASSALDAMGQDLTQQMGLAFSILGKILGYSREIENIERDPNNPVTIAAIKTDGILRFANPVQRRTVLRALSGTQEAGGIQFLRPPSSSN